MRQPDRFPKPSKQQQASSKLSSEENKSNGIRFINNMAFSCAVGVGIGLFFYFTAPASITICAAFYIGGGCAAGAMLICKIHNYCTDRDHERMLKRAARQLRKDLQTATKKSLSQTDQVPIMTEKLKNEKAMQALKEGLAKKDKKHGIYHRALLDFYVEQKKMPTILENSEEEELSEPNENLSATEEPQLSPRCSYFCHSRESGNPSSLTSFL